MIVSCVNIVGLMAVPLLLLAIAMGPPKLALGAVVIASICLWPLTFVLIYGGRKGLDQTEHRGFQETSDHFCRRRYR